MIRMCFSNAEITCIKLYHLRTAIIFLNVFNCGYIDVVDVYKYVISHTLTLYTNIIISLRNIFIIDDMPEFESVTFKCILGTQNSFSTTGSLLYFLQRIASLLFLDYST